MDKCRHQEHGESIRTRPTAADHGDGIVINHW
jgi:hypothetical protein